RTEGGSSPAPARRRSPRPPSPRTTRAAARCPGSRRRAGNDDGTAPLLPWLPPRSRGEEGVALALQRDVGPHGVLRGRVGAHDGAPRAALAGVAHGVAADLGPDRALLERAVQRRVAHPALAEDERDAVRGRPVGGDVEPEAQLLVHRDAVLAVVVVEPPVERVRVAPV